MLWIFRYDSMALRKVFAESKKTTESVSGRAYATG